MRTLVNDLDPADTHVEFQSLGGVVVETRVQRRPSLTIQRADRLNDGTIRVTGKLSVQGFSSLYDPAHPFRVMVQAVDANRRFEHTMMEISAVASNGTFHAQITDPTPGSPVLEVVAMFAGTVELASASTGYVDTVATDFYYAFDAVSGHLVEIDAVGGQARHVGSTGISEWLNGLALTNAGVLYGHSANAGEFGGNNFYKIDRLSGAATLIGPIQKIVGGAMAYDPETDSIYTTTATGGFLVKINPGTGRGTTSGAGVPGLTSPTAAAYDTRNHRLIVFDNADDQFYSFDPATGNATLLSSASPVLSGMAMAYNGSNFVISDHNTKTLRLLNPDTGVSSPLLTPSEPLNLAALEFVDRFSQGGLLGIDWSAATIYDVDPTTGAVSNPRPTDLEDTVGIAFAADHTLYTLTASTASSYPNSLFKLDRVTGAATLVGPTGLGQIAEADLDFDPTTGILYGVQNILPVGQRQLFTIDASTGRATVVGSIGTADYSAMAFDVRGNLYVLNTTSNVLLRVNKSTAATISSTPLSRNLGFVAGMDFDPATGTLYVVDGGSGGTDALYTLDPDTGVLTPMGGTRLASGLGGLAFVPITGVIRGTSFNDRNGDGTRDSGEEGLPNRQVFLDENNNGAINPITTTTRSGAAGVVPDVGAIPYPLVATGLVARLTDLNVTLNVTHPFMASLYGYLVSPHGTKVDLFIPGQIGGASLVNTTFDDEATRRISGGVPGGTVSFQAEGLLSEFDGEDPSGVWQLVIHDTVRDNFLGVLSGWSITFTHGERVVTTDDKGEYVFAGLKPETYTVAEVQQAGWIQTVPWSPNSHRVSVGKGQVRAGRDFGNFQSGEIQGASFNDRNGNGTRGPSEEGLPNRQVFLDQNNNGAVDPVTTTTRHGSAGIIPDVAAIPFPLAVTDLVAPIVDLNVTLTIAHPRVEILDAYLVSPMGTRVELFSPGRFGGGAITATFDDEATKAEGMLAAFDGEDPTGAWLLMITDVLTDSSVGVVSGWSMQFTHGERVVTTNANGNYSFKGLKPGTYKVAEVPQPGWLHTYPNGNPATWEVVLGSGQSITEIDFGSTTVDTTPPVFANVPADLTIKATIPDGAIVTYVPPTASDTLDPAPVVTCNPASGTTFPLGITKVTCTATDDAGNSAEVVFAVTVQEATSQDTLGPTLDSLQLVRDAKGKKVTQIVLAFNEELNPVGAQTVTANYDLTLRKGSNLKPVKISSAAYSERTVTLTPRKPISFKKRADYDLTVKGNGTLTDAHGNPYDGDSDGNPGGDLVRSLSQGTIRSNIDALLEQRKLTRWLTLET
jgi:subtilisin-like proprotein convertase family protein